MTTPADPAPRNDGPGRVPGTLPYEELTRAADLIRKRARLAGRGEWNLHVLPPVPDGIAIGSPARHMITRDGRNIAHVSERASAHVAGLSPIVGVELADMLREMALKTQSMTHPQDWVHCEDPDSVMLALGLARTYWAHSSTLSGHRSGI